METGCCCSGAGFVAAVNDLLPDIMRALDAEPDPEALAKASEEAPSPCMPAFAVTSFRLMLRVCKAGTGGASAPVCALACFSM